MKANEAIKNLTKVKPYSHVMVEVNGNLYVVDGFKIMSATRRTPGEEMMTQNAVFTVKEND